MDTFERARFEETEHRFAKLLSRDNTLQSWQRAPHYWSYLVDNKHLFIDKKFKYPW